MTRPRTILMVLEGIEPRVCHSHNRRLNHQANEAVSTTDKSRANPTNVTRLVKDGNSYSEGWVKLGPMSDLQKTAGASAGIPECTATQGIELRTMAGTIHCVETFYTILGGFFRLLEPVSVHIL